MSHTNKTEDPEYDAQDASFDKFWEEHEEAKICPFCGEDDLVIERKRNRRSPYNYYYFIKCTICKASSGAYADMEAAYKHWQTRA